MKKTADPLKDFLRRKASENPTGNKADPKLDRAPKSPSILLGVLFGFLLRCITELVKHLIPG